MMKTAIESISVSKQKILPEMQAILEWDLSK
jgi:hypothetical protein